MKHLKRVLSVLLSVIIIFLSFPTVAFAKDYSPASTTFVVWRKGDTTGSGTVKSIPFSTTIYTTSTVVQLELRSDVNKLSWKEGDLFNLDIDMSGSSISSCRVHFDFRGGTASSHTGTGVFSNGHVILKDVELGADSDGYYSNFWIYLDNFSFTSDSATIKVNSYNLSIDTPDESFRGKISGFFSDLFGRLTSWFDTMFEWLKDIGNKISSGFTNLTSSISSFFSDLTSVITSWFSAIADWFQTLFDGIKSWFDSLTSVITAWFGAIADWFQTLFDGIRDWFVQLGDKISGFFTTLWNNITSTVNSITESVKSWWKGVVDWFNSLFTVDDDYFTNYKNKFDQFFSDHFGFLYQSISLIQTFFIQIKSAFESPENPIIIIPEITLPFFNNPVIVHHTTFNLSDFFNSHSELYNIYEIVNIFFGAIVLLASVNYGIKTMKKLLDMSTSEED